MLRYTIAMSVRFACFLACIVTPGWWILIPAVGAVVLPYIAVVIANVSTKSAATVQQPALGLVVPYRPQTEPGANPGEERAS
jgi:hypothetical protein